MCNNLLQYIRQGNERGALKKRFEEAVLRHHEDFVGSTFFTKCPKFQFRTSYKAYLGLASLKQSSILHLAVFLMRKINSLSCAHYQFIYENRTISVLPQSISELCTLLVNLQKPKHTVSTFLKKSRDAIDNQSQLTIISSS